MKMLFESGASGTPPAAPSPGSAGYPSDGDLATSTPPTIPGAYAFYQLFQELLTVINAAGITPDASDLGQLKAALDALYAGGSSFVSSFATNGYQKFPGGLILQWGTYTSDISVPSGSAPSPVTVTFPITFPTQCLNVSMTTRNPANDYVADSWPELYSASAASFQMTPQNTGNAGSTDLLHGFTWLAIGN
jgi:hypothetical protein